MITIQGKGFYIWQLKAPEMPNPEQLAEELVEKGFSHVLIKIADGAVSYEADVIEDYVKALRKTDLMLIGWQYVYLKNPTFEAARAVERMKTLGLDAFVIDAEAEAKLVNAATMQVYVNGLSAIEKPIGLSSYRWPSVHPELAWTILMSVCSFVMPQVYWANAANPGEQLERCVREYKLRWPSIPIVPTGAAYQEYGWRPTAGEIQEFAAKCEELGLTGYNFWEMANAIRYGLYNIVCNLETGGLPPEPTTPTTVTVRSSALNMRAEPTTGGNVPIGTLRRGFQGPILEEMKVNNQRWVKTSGEFWICADYYGTTLAEVN